MRRIALVLLVIISLVVVSRIDMVYPQSPLPSKTSQPTATKEQIIKPPTSTPATRMLFPAVFEQQRITNPK